LEPYALNNAKTAVVNKFAGGVGRLEKIDFSIDFELKSKKGEGDDESGASTGRSQGMALSRAEGYTDYANDNYYDIKDEIVNYVDFDIPWSLTGGYKYVYSKPLDESKVTQTISLTGTLSLTKKWNISFRTNYDITEKELSSTSLNIKRDLHCWEMTFSWIPVGRMQSYNFQINVKGSTLRDMLKYNKRKSWQDNL